MSAVNNHDRLLINRLLLTDSGLKVSKLAVQKIGLESAVILAILLEIKEMSADEEGWFSCSHKVIEEVAGLSKYKQDKAIKTLEETGLIISDKRKFKFIIN